MEFEKTGVELNWLTDYCLLWTFRGLWSVSWQEHDSGVTGMTRHNWRNCAGDICSIPWRVQTWQPQNHRWFTGLPSMVFHSATNHKRRSDIVTVTTVTVCLITLNFERLNFELSDLDDHRLGKVGFAGWLGLVTWLLQFLLLLALPGLKTHTHRHTLSVRSQSSESSVGSQNIGPLEKSLVELWRSLPASALMRVFVKSFSTGVGRGLSKCSTCHCNLLPLSLSISSVCEWSFHSVALDSKQDQVSWLPSSY